VEDLEQARVRFAKEIQQLGHIRSTGLIEGLATIPREDFMGPGPWRIMRGAEMAKGYQLTPDSNPRHLYENVLVALDERRLLNNGEPLGLLLFLDSLTLCTGDRFLHIGCGVGYYTAIASRAVGPRGTVVGVEIDTALAARAESNLRPYRTVKVVVGDGTLGPFGTFDAVFVNAGCTRPLSLWVDQLAVGGRLLIPLTVTLPTMPGIGAGSMLLVTREATGYGARFTAPVGIFHCEGARSGEEEALLAKAFGSGGRNSVRRLRHDPHEPSPNCWLHTANFCLESDPALRQRHRVRIQVDAQVLAGYVGRYQLAPNIALVVMFKDGGLFAQLAGPSAVPIYPETQTTFFYEAIDAQITFLTDASGRATGLLFRHDGHDVPAQRTE